MQGTVSARIDADLKQEAMEVLKEIGLDMSTAINVYLKEIVRSRKIPFELSADPFYSESNMNYLNNLIEEYETGKIQTEKHELIRN
jgi:DNA-damage-inducible protein J